MRLDEEKGMSVTDAFFQTLLKSGIQIGLAGLSGYLGAKVLEDDSTYAGKIKASTEASVIGQSIFSAVAFPFIMALTAAGIVNDDNLQEYVSIAAHLAPLFAAIATDVQKNNDHDHLSFGAQAGATFVGQFFTMLVILGIMAGAGCLVGTGALAVKAKESCSDKCGKKSKEDTAANDATNEIDVEQAPVTDKPKVAELLAGDAGAGDAGGGVRRMASTHSDSSLVKGLSVAELTVTLMPPAADDDTEVTATAEDQRGMTSVI